MGKPKKLIKNLQVTIAGNSHNCKSNRQHRISKGESRLTVKEGQNAHHYCLDCGSKFVSIALDELRTLQKDIRTLGTT